MKTSYRDIVLRDYVLADVEDEIRWTNEETAWFYADTPWMTLEKEDPDTLRREMTEIISSMTEDAIRWRFEIEISGRHVGMVSSYYLDDTFQSIPWSSIDQKKNARENGAIRTLGIEICETDCWGKGYGTQALTALMDYYRSFGENRFFLETWSGNQRMMSCAKKLGFTEAGRRKNEICVSGQYHDEMILEKRFPG